MLAGLDRIAEPKMGVHRGEVPEDHEIRVAVALRSVHYLRDPAQRLGHPSPRLDVAEKPPEYRHQGIVAMKRVRQPQRRM